MTTRKLPKIDGKTPTECLRAERLFTSLPDETAMRKPRDKKVYNTAGIAIKSYKHFHFK